MQLRAMAMARWVFAGAGPADQHGIALLGDEATAGEVVDERLVDRRAFEPEVVDILGEWQLGDGELVLDRACLLLADLGVEQITDDALGVRGMGYCGVVWRGIGKI